MARLMQRALARNESLGAAHRWSWHGARRAHRAPTLSRSGGPLRLLAALQAWLKRCLIISSGDARLADPGRWVDSSRVHLKSDIPRLQRRIGLLTSATRLALACGLRTSLLVIVGFLFAFVGLQYIYGATVLFLSALALLGASLFQLTQEVKIGLGEADHYR